MSELAELLEMKLMLSTTPVMSRGDSGLKLRDLVIEVSRWILGGNDNFTLTSNRWPDRSSLHPQKRRRPPLPDGRDGLARSFVHCLTLVGDTGWSELRDQPTYDRNGVTSPIARFRHPCHCRTGAMPYAIPGVGRSVGPLKLLVPRFQVMDLLTQY